MRFYLTIVILAYAIVLMRMRVFSRGTILVRDSLLSVAKTPFALYSVNHIPQEDNRKAKSYMGLKIVTLRKSSGVL